MRIAALVAVYVASLLANPYPDPDPSGTGMGVLTIWPTARSTALAGTMTGLADEADATYFNPAGLAFQTTAKADVTHASWLPGLYPGMYYESAAGGAPVRLPFLNMVMRFTHHASAVESMCIEDARPGNARKTAISVS